MQPPNWFRFFLFLTAFLMLVFSSSHAQKPMPNRHLEMIPNEEEPTARIANMRVSQETGAPIALYQVNYPVAPGSAEKMAKQYLRENAALLKIQDDLADLVHTATRETPGGFHVRFRQYIYGYPVYGGNLVVNLDWHHKVTFVMNSYKPLARLNNPSPEISKTQAKQMAIDYLKVQGKIDYENEETIVYYNKGETRLAHKITLVPAEDTFGDWEVLVDAHGGNIFRVEDKAFYDSPRSSTPTTGSGWVFDPDPLTRARALYQAGGQFGDNNDADTDSLIAQIVQRNLLEIDFDGSSYHLRGPYAEIIDFESPFNGLFSRPDSIWHSTRNPDAFEAANVYFHLDQSMRYINETLGFTLMPFQYSGGVQGDPHGLSGADNSHYISSTGRLAWGEGGVDDAEDEDVVLHELGHGIHDWLTNGNLSQVEGLSEGCGDYWAASYNRSTGFWTPSDPQYFWVFQWDGHNEFWPGRITNYTAQYPGGLVGQIHTDGQIWASTLMQIYEDIGRTACDANFLECLSMTNGASNQEDAAQAFVQADVNLHNGANLQPIEFWFTQRGYNVNIPLAIPSTPDSVQAYSDYTTPNSIQLSWDDPSIFTNGDTLMPDQFTVKIRRGDSLIASLPGGTEQLIDTGLVDGQEYHYAVFVQVDSTGAVSDVVELSWTAGGSPIPAAPLNFSLAGTQSEVTVSWISPSTNVDGTPMDDYAGIHLYQNGTMVATFARTNADTGITDTISYAPAVPGFFDWYITIIDDETPQNESEPSIALGTPLSIPVTDEFTVPGDPNPGIWINSNAEINNRSVNPPTGPYALNLNGTPDGEDIVDLKPLDLSGMEGSDIFFSFFYQPQGNGNAPELVDSLQVYFKNDAGDWILVRFYEGVSLQPFQQEVIDIESAPNGGGSYFHGQFQVRLRSLGGASNLPNDDWFIDDVVLDVPTGLKASKILPTHYALDQNYPNPFNPTTTIAYQLPTISDVELTIYNVLGQKVRTLVDKRQTAGFYQIQWDGRNQFGEKVSSGIYIYKLKAADFVQSRKLILLK